MRRAAEQDAVPAALAESVFGADTDLCAVYLPGLDIAQYNLLGSSGGSGLPASALAARLESLERYYGYLDAVIAPFVDRAAAGHAWSPSWPTRAGPPRVGLGCSRWPAGPTVGGRPSRRQRRRRRPDAPLPPWCAGQPGVAGHGSAGSWWTRAFAAGTRWRACPSYAPRIVAPRPPAASPLDRDMLERLRSLGYVR